MTGFLAMHQSCTYSGSSPWNRRLKGIVLSQCKVPVVRNSQFVLGIRQKCRHRRTHVIRGVKWTLAQGQNGQKSANQLQVKSVTVCKRFIVHNMPLVSLSSTRASQLRMRIASRPNSTILAIRNKEDLNRLSVPCLVTAGNPATPRRRRASEGPRHLNNTAFARLRTRFVSLNDSRSPVHGPWQACFLEEQA